MAERVPRPRRLLVICGIHAAGKSTAVGLLSRLGYLGHPEIGWAYRQAIMFDEPESLALQREDLPWFDQAILELELLRDQFIERASTIPHCVETWHLGNLAYAELRSPALVPQFERSLKSQSLLFKPAFLILTIERETFLGRCAMPDMSAPDLYAFYMRVQANIIRRLSYHACQYVSIPNDGTIEELWERLKIAVAQLTNG